MTYYDHKQVHYADSPSVDAFGRVRVSNPTTLFDSKQLYDKSPLVWDEVLAASATSVHSTANAATTMSVTGNGDYAIRQTRMRFNYQPGKSQEVFMTFVLGDPVAQTEKRIGYFNSATTGDYDTGFDGIYLKQDGDGTYLVVAKGGTETEIPQAEWNLDRFDGRGGSRELLDWTKTQILVIDFEWLGVGRVRVGFNVDGQTHYAHEFRHANRKTSVYMSSPNHSLRYEIRSTGGASSIDHICGSVISEGGLEENGILRCVTTGGVHVDMPAENTSYAILGIRLKSTHLDSIVKLVNYATQISTATDKLELSLILNPDVAGTFLYSPVVNSSVEAAVGAATNIVTNGTVLQASYVESGGAQAGSAGSKDSQAVNSLRIGAKIDGTQDTIVLAGKPIAGSTDVDVEGSLFWRELQ